MSKKKRPVKKWEVSAVFRKSKIFKHQGRFQLEIMGDIIPSQTDKNDVCKQSKDNS